MEKALMRLIEPDDFQEYLEFAIVNDNWVLFWIVNFSIAIVATNYFPQE